MDYKNQTLAQRLNILLATASTWRMRLAVFLSLIVVLLVYWPGLSGTFIFDDTGSITRNTAVHISDLSFASIKQAWGSFIFGPSGRPLAMLTFGIDHVIWGANPFGYKLSSLIWHLLNALLIMILADRILRQADMIRKDGSSRFAPVLLGLLWAIHPIQASTVLYVVQRMEIMALTFSILSLLSYLRGRRLQIEGRRGSWLWLLLTATLSCVAILCKETGALVPLFALCLELTILRFRAKNRRDTLALQVFYALGITLAFAYFFSTIWPRHTGPDSYLSRDFNWQERLLTQLRVLPTYLGWIIWPDPQRYLFYYDSYNKSTGWLQQATTMLGAMFLSALLALALWLRHKQPLISLGILWFFSAHALTSNVIPLELVFEHRNYFAVFAVLLVGMGLINMFQEHTFKLPCAAISLVLVAGLATLTVITSATWGNPLTLALDLSHKNPSSERANYDLGEIYRQMSNQNPKSPFFDMARTSFTTAAAIPGSSPLPEHALIAMMGLAGQSADAAWWDSLIAKIETGPRGPQQIISVRTLLQLHNSEAAIDSDRLMDAGIALINKPGLNPSIHFEFALHALTALGDESLAAQILIIGSTIAGDQSWNHNVLEALAARGHGEFASHLQPRLAGSRELPTGNSARLEN